MRNAVKRILLVMLTAGALIAVVAVIALGPVRDAAVEAGLAGGPDKAELWAAEYARLRELVRPDEPKAQNRALLSGLFIHGLECAFDAQSGTFFFPTPAGRLYARNFGYALGVPDAGPVLLIWESADPEYGAAYSVTAISRYYTYTYSLIFTGLPIVQITGITDAQMSRTLRGAGFAITYYNADRGLTRIESAAQIRHRGASSMMYDKKNFALRLVDRGGGDNNISLLGMRRGNAWVLDAMYIDRSKMRDRVSMNIWNSFNAPLLHAHLADEYMLNGTRGEFVELFIGGEYWGLYCLTETINRRQLGLLHYDPQLGVQSIIYQGEHWGDPILFRSYGSGPPNHYFWGGWRQDFPDPRRGLPVLWDPLYDFVRFAVNASDEEFAAHASEFIHVENFVDYTIFQMITYAWDNTGKNIHWSIYDVAHPELNRLFLTPWDLDATWGDTWHFGRTEPARNWMNMSSEHDSMLWRRLINTNAGGFRDKLEARWAALRVAQLSLESIKAQFELYFTLFEDTGAWDREMRRWPRRYFRGVTLQNERGFIFDWVETRWAFIDDFIADRLDDVRRFDRRRFR